MTSTARAQDQRRQGRIGLFLAGLIVASWLAVHIIGVFVLDISDIGWVLSLGLVALGCWLSVGMFIVAHDCMHGTLVPGRPGVNRWVGRLCLTLYAGFDFDTLREKHHLHHRFSGTKDDPDFDAHPPHGFVGWYLRFFLEYFGLRQLMFMTGVVAVYSLVLGAVYANLLLFWALPAILSSVQLFTFGTYLPHHPNDEPFEDGHRARSTDFGPLLSLLTCFHFGYHHTHHDRPWLPWWRLPKEHRSTRNTVPARQQEQGTRAGADVGMEHARGMAETCGAPLDSR